MQYLGKNHLKMFTKNGFKEKNLEELERITDDNGFRVKDSWNRKNNSHVIIAENQDLRKLGLNYRFLKSVLIFIDYPELFWIKINKFMEKVYKI